MNVLEKLFVRQNFCYDGGINLCQTYMYVPITIYLQLINANFEDTPCKIPHRHRNISNFFITMLLYYIFYIPKNQKYLFI